MNDGLKQQYSFPIFEDLKTRSLNVDASQINHLFQSDVTKINLSGRTGKEFKSNIIIPQ